MFVGTHERQLDDKGRLTLPPPFRTHMQGSCYLSIGDDRCVTIHTAEAFERRANDLLAQVRTGEMSQNRLRAIAGAAALVSIDRQGRITIDEHMRTFARLEPSSKVVLSGALDHGEIWCEQLFAGISSAGQGELAGLAGGAST